MQNIQNKHAKYAKDGKLGIEIPHAKYALPTLSVRIVRSSDTESNRADSKSLILTVIRVRVSWLGAWALSLTESGRTLPSDRKQSWHELPGRPSHKQVELLSWNYYTLLYQCHNVLLCNIMTLFQHNKTHNDTIIRYYFPYYFPYYDTRAYYFLYYFSYYDTLFFIFFLLFSIMTGSF